MMLQVTLAPEDSFRSNIFMGGPLPEPSAPPLAIDIDLKQDTKHIEPVKNEVEEIENRASESSSKASSDDFNQSYSSSFPPTNVPYATPIITLDLSDDNILEASEVFATSAIASKGDPTAGNFLLSVRAVMPKRIESLDAVIEVYKKNFNLDFLKACGKEVLVSAPSLEWSKTNYYTAAEIEEMMLKEAPSNQAQFVHFSAWREEHKKSRIKGTHHRLDLVMKDVLHNGLMVPDAALFTVADVRQFFYYHNTRPNLYISVHYTLEHENRSPQVIKRDIDITKYIFPFGRIIHHGKRSINKVIFDYLDSDNRLKSLRMTKRVSFDFKTLATLIKEYLSKCHHATGIKVFIKSKQVSVRVYADSLRSSIWESPVGRIITLATIVGGIGLTLYGEIHRNRSLRSNFAILYSPLEIFDAIREDIL